MPLHDHPNMSVYFKLMFGKLNYSIYDKVDDKYKYNMLSNDEYDELLETKARIPAKKSAPKTLDKNNLLLVRPSSGNMHKFVAEEDSCFFDICLPNYTQDSLRRITYFNEVAEPMIGEEHTENRQHAKANTMLEYHVTPPVLPVGFEINELNYQGEMLDTELVPRKIAMV